MRSLARKVIIDDVQPIPDADRIEVARVGGWNVVVQKGQFVKGSVALYIEIDAFLSVFDSRYEFLKSSYKILRLAGQVYDEGYRIRTMKMRGVLSQGLLMPVEKFYEIRDKAIGEDCTQALGIRHYDEVYADWMSHCGNTKTGLPKGSFPSFIPKTDEERIQNLSEATINAWMDEDFEVTEKRDGTSCTIYWCPARSGVCSRNLERKDSPCVYWDIEHKLNLLERLEKYCTEKGGALAIQGEITGPGIQGNPDNGKELKFEVFRIWEIGERRWLTWAERYSVCDSLGLDHVPVKGAIIPREAANSNDPQTIRQFLLNMADGVTASGNPREGLVFKSKEGDFSFKVVSNEYLLKQK